jgi:hypothetical protein
MALRFLVLLSCYAIIIVSSVQAQEPASLLDKTAVSYSLAPSNLPEALVRVSNDFHIPMGIVWVDSGEARDKLPFAWKNAKVRQIIEDIVAAHQGYEVRFENDLAGIAPSQLLIADPQNFLKLKLHSFEAHGDLVEVASFRLHMEITPKRYSQMSIGATGDSKVDLSLKDAKVEDILSALALASNRKIWVVTFMGDHEVTAKGLRRTKSLWGAKPQPDEDQPGWDLFRWGDPLPSGMSGSARWSQRSRENTSPGR